SRRNNLDPPGGDNHAISPDKLLTRPAVRNKEMNVTKILRLTQFSIAFVVMALCSATAFGQGTAARPDRGITPGASYSVSDFESISLSSGNVNLSIPLASLPPIAGGKLKFTLSAVYNSKLWNMTRKEYQLDPFYGCS